MNIYIVTDRDYDEYCIYGVFSSKEKAEAFINKHKKLDEFWRILNSHSKKWEETNPRPVVPELKAVPKWPAGLSDKQITTEMRAARDSITIENRQKYKEYEKAYHDWDERMQEHRTSVLKEMNLEPWFFDKLNYPRFSPVYHDFRIEEFEVD